MVPVSSVTRRRAWTTSRRALDELVASHAGGRRPRPAPPVGRPRVRGQGQRDGRDRHAHRRRAGRGRPGRRRSGRPAGPHPGHPEPQRGASSASGPATASRSTWSGSSATEVARGDAVVQPGRWRPTVRLRRLADRARRPRPRRLPPRRLRGLRRLGRAPGDGAGPRRLGHRARVARATCGSTSTSRVPLLPGDRYVLRECGRSETVGGGEVLDVAPVLPASKVRPAEWPVDVTTGSWPSGGGSPPTSWRR